MSVLRILEAIDTMVAAPACSTRAYLIERLATGFTSARVLAALQEYTVVLTDTTRAAVLKAMLCS